MLLYSNVQCDHSCKSLNKRWWRIFWPKKRK